MSNEEESSDSTFGSEFRDTVAQRVTKEIDIFLYYSPSKTFSSENLSNEILDMENSIVTDAFFGRGETINIGDYFDKGKQCFEIIVNRAKKYNKGFDPIASGADLMVSAYCEMVGHINWIADLLQKRKSVELVDSETDERIDISDYVSELLHLDTMYNAFQSIPRSQEFLMYDDLAHAFAALQYIDEIIFELITSQGSMMVHSTSSFHDCYFKSVKYEEVIQQMNLSIQKERTVAAIAARSERTLLRNQYAIKLWEKSGQSPKEFAYKASNLNQINEHSKTIGKTPLTLHSGGDTIYRMILNYKKDLKT